VKLALQLLSFTVTLLIGPLLPERYRKHWPLPVSMDEPGLQTIHAYIHAVAAVALLAVAYAAYQISFSDWMTDALWDPDLLDQMDLDEKVPMAGFGLLGMFSFLMSVRGILCGLYVLDSMVRVVAATASGGQVPGSAWFNLPLVGWEYFAKAAREKGMDTRYGKADEPLNIRFSGGGILVRSTRPRESWHAALSFSFRGNLYRLVEAGEGREEGRSCFDYRFEPWPENDMVRRIIVLDPDAPPEEA